MDDTRVTAVGAIQPTFAHRAEYAALRGAVAAMERLSFPRAGGIGQRIGRLGYWPLGIRRAVETGTWKEVDTIELSPELADVQSARFCCNDVCASGTATRRS